MGVGVDITVEGLTDLPVPDGPRRTLISPLGIVTFTSDQTFALRRLVSPSTVISTPTPISILLSLQRST